MKRIIRNILILFSPIAFIILVNETSTQLTKPTTKNCSWKCHDETTSFCKVHHVKYAKPYFNQIDSVYFGIINSLKFTGDYRGANILFLVVLIPVVIYLLLVRIIDMEIQIRKLKH